jgi:hypothetical protein
LYPSHQTPCEITPDRLILRHEEVVGRCAASSLAALSQGVQDGHHSFLYRTILPEAGQKGKAVRPANDVSVLVVDRDNDLLFTPLLWTVANGRASPNNVIGVLQTPPSLSTIDDEPTTGSGKPLLMKEKKKGRFI